MKFDVVASYTRKEAIADGVQVRIEDKIRREAGIKVPVFVTETVWDRYLKVPAGLEGCQDMEGRIWDMLYTSVVVARMKRTTSRFTFKVLFQMPKDLALESNERKHGNVDGFIEVELISEIGAMDFDDPSPAITISTAKDN